MEKWKGHGITLRNNEREWLFGDPDWEAGPCWHAGEWKKPYAGTSSWTCRLRVLWQRLISPRLSVRSKRRFMEIPASAEGKHPEGWGRDQKCGKFHNHGNSKLSVEKRNFIPLSKHPESRSNLLFMCLPVLHVESVISMAMTLCSRRRQVSPSVCSRLTFPLVQGHNIISACSVPWPCILLGDPRTEIIRIHQVCCMSHNI